MTSVSSTAASLPIGVLGAGNFGRAVARAASRAGRRVELWGRTPRDLSDARIHSTSDLSVLAEAELIFVAIPSQYVRAAATDLGAYLDGRHLLVHVSRGLIGEELLTITQCLREVTAARRVGALAGPLDADALANGAPCGAIVGSRFDEVARAVRDAIGGPALRIYDTRDVIGVEVASAMVGLLALATGYASEAGVGPAALAVFLTRGMAEATRLAVSLGAQSSTLMGLAGYGDLMAVAAGDERPEVRLGRALARGQRVQEAAEAAGANIEGVSIAARVAQFAEVTGLEAPIAAVIARFVDGELSRDAAIAALMARRVGRE